jgi:hypothetical protein
MCYSSSKKSILEFHMVVGKKFIQWRRLLLDFGSIVLHVQKVGVLLFHHSIK